MSVVKRIIKDNIERVEVDELLSKEYEQAGYGGITLTKTPLGAQINLFAMRPGRVIGKRGRAIKAASEKLETKIGLSNPQITVVEVEVPELNPQIMAARVANALERGVHFRRAIFWSLRRIMDSGALGCEVLLKGPLRSARSRFEKVVEGYVPKSGDPAQKFVRKATMHVKMKRGSLGVTVSIVPPDAKFPDKVDLSELPVFEYQPPIELETQSESIDEPKTEVVLSEDKSINEKNTLEPTSEQEKQVVEPEINKDKLKAEPRNPTQDTQNEPKSEETIIKKLKVVDTESSEDNKEE